MGHRLGERTSWPNCPSAQYADPDAKRVYDKITAKRGQMKGGPFASLDAPPGAGEEGRRSRGVSAVRRNPARRRPGDGHSDHGALGQSGVRVGGARGRRRAPRSCRTTSSSGSARAATSRRFRHATRARRGSSSVCSRTSRSRKICKIRSRATSACPGLIELVMPRRSVPADRRRAVRVRLAAAGGHTGAVLTVACDGLRVPRRHVRERASQDTLGMGDVRRCRPRRASPPESRA